MKRVMKAVVISLAVAVTIFVLFGTGLGYLWSDDTVEMARRVACEARQKEIYAALKEYLADYRDLPAELNVLVEQGYLDKADIYCPTPPDHTTVRLYDYLPQNFGDPNLPVVSENVENHSSMKLRLRRLERVRIQTMGDGSTKPIPIISVR